MRVCLGGGVNRATHVRDRMCCVLRRYPQGTFSTIYRATHLSTLRRGAIKVHAAGTFACAGLGTAGEPAYA